MINDQDLTQSAPYKCRPAGARSPHTHPARGSRCERISHHAVESVLLRTLAAVQARTAGSGVPSFVPKWRAGQNKTANTYVIEIAI